MRRTPRSEGGLEMMQMAQQRGTSAVKSMAARMEKDQRKEIAELTVWTGGTHEQPTSTSGHTDHQKMMSATGAEFDRLFLDMMSQHHQQVIDLSTQALPQLKEGRIKAFARQTVTKQTREKTEMQRMLATKTKA